MGMGLNDLVWLGVTQVLQSVLALVHNLLIQAEARLHLMSPFWKCCRMLSRSTSARAARFALADLEQIVQQLQKVGQLQSGFCL